MFEDREHPPPSTEPVEERDPDGETRTKFDEEVDLQAATAVRCGCTSQEDEADGQSHPRRRLLRARHRHARRAAAQIHGPSQSRDRQHPSRWPPMSSTGEAEPERRTGGRRAAEQPAAEAMPISHGS
jgi:predicted ATPase